MPLIGEKPVKDEPPKAAGPPPTSAAVPVRLSSNGSKATPPDERVTDRVLAIVNNDAITLSEIQEAIAVYKYENRDRATESSDQLVQQFLTRMIDSRLQVQEAEREKIVIDEAEIDEELADRIKKMNMKNREEFEAALRAQGIPMASRSESESPTSCAARPKREPEGAAPHLGDGRRGLAVSRGESAEARDGSRRITRATSWSCPRPAPRTPPGRTRGSGPSCFGRSCCRAPTSPSWRSSIRATRAPATAGIWERSSAASSRWTSRRRSWACQSERSRLRIGPRSGITSSTGIKETLEGEGLARVRVADSRDLFREKFDTRLEAGSRRSNSAPSSTCAWMDNSEKH